MQSDSCAASRAKPPWLCRALLPLLVGCAGAPTALQTAVATGQEAPAATQALFSRWVWRGTQLDLEWHLPATAESL